MYEENFHLHDTVARSSYERLGIGVQYQLTESFDLNLGYITTLSGKNTHDLQGLVLGTSWGF